MTSQSSQNIIQGWDKKLFVKNNCTIGRYPALRTAIRCTTTTMDRSFIKSLKTGFKKLQILKILYHKKYSAHKTPPLSILDAILLIPKA